MSDLSMIAHDYELNAEFARRFNDAVLNLKRVYLLHRAAMPETQEKIDQSRGELRRLLESLVSALQNNSKAWSAEQVRVPADVLERLRKQLKGELPETVQDLRHVVDLLVAGRPLDEAAFSAVDKVCEAADATASAAFRRLRRI